MKRILITIGIIFLIFNAGCGEEKNISEEVKREVENDENINEEKPDNAEKNFGETAKLDESSELEVIKEGESVQITKDSKIYFQGVGELELNIKEDIERPLKKSWESIGGEELNNPYEEKKDIDGPQPSVEGGNFFLEHRGFSPNENYLAFSIDHTSDINPYSIVGIVNVELGKIFYTNAVDNNVSTISWSSDNKYIAYGATDLVPSTTGIYIDSISEGSNEYSTNVAELSGKENILVEDIKWSKEENIISLTGIRENEEGFKWFIDFKTGELILD